MVKLMARKKQVIEYGICSHKLQSLDTVNEQSIMVLIQLRRLKHLLPILLYQLLHAELG